MTKLSRKKRRRRRRDKKHDFSPGPVTSQKPVEAKSDKLTSADIAVPAGPNFAWQKSDMITTLTLAAVILVGFALIAYFDSQYHFLVEMGQGLTGYFGLSL